MGSSHAHDKPFNVPQKEGGTAKEKAVEKTKSLTIDYMPTIYKGHINRHGVRKCSGTFATTATILPSPIPSVLMRGGEWSRGKVLEFSTKNKLLLLPYKLLHRLCNKWLQWGNDLRFETERLQRIILLEHPAILHLLGSLRVVLQLSRSWCSGTEQDKTRLLIGMFLKGFSYHQ